jgi:hypothetical protein
MRRLAPWLLVGALILGAGALAESSWRRIRPSIPEIGRKELEPTLGQGVLLGVLGGLRTVVADFAWIRSYVFWERRDRPACETLMRTACTLDPHARYFWENAGLRIGLDMAHWEIRRRGGYAKVPAETQERLFRQYARRGLDVLEEGLGHARNRTALLLAAGFIAEGKLKDLRLAADYYRQAAEAPDAPWYAARIAADFDWGAGRRAEAYRWYRQYWEARMRGKEDGFPEDLIRLRTMENELRLGLTQRIPRQAWER